jgi:hypothetical protein
MNVVLVGDSSRGMKKESLFGVRLEIDCNSIVFKLSNFGKGEQPAVGFLYPLGE